MKTPILIIAAVAALGAMLFVQTPREIAETCVPAPVAAVPAKPATATPAEPAPTKPARRTCDPALLKVIPK